MRLIGTLFSEMHARKMASYLKQKGIDSNCDMAFDAQTGQMTYHLWVIDEDRTVEAASDFERFQKRPADPEFDGPVVVPMGSEAPPPQIAESSVRTVRTPLTMFFLGLCFAIFSLNLLQEQPLLRSGLRDIFLFTPIQELLLYDFPSDLASIEQMVQEKIEAAGQKGVNLASEVQLKLQEHDKTPQWRGFYEWVVLKIKGLDTQTAEGPLFSNIREGEIWRLFSPCVLHAEFFHIFFNMIWLWILGRPIEQRIGFPKTLLLTALVGIGSNTIQYLVSGPLFLGYSGIVMGLAGFTWMRQKIAPWEGYPLNRITMIFLLLFVGAMFILSMGAFFLQIFSGLAFAPNIANTAHIIGGIIGIFFGRLSSFAERVVK